MSQLSWPGNRRQHVTPDRPAEANVVQGLIVETERLVRVLDELVHRQRAVVRLHDSVRHLRRRHDGEREHDAVRVLLANLRD